MVARGAAVSDDGVGAVFAAHAVPARRKHHTAGPVHAYDALGPPPRRLLLRLLYPNQRRVVGVMQVGRSEVAISA